MFAGITVIVHYFECIFFNRLSFRLTLSKIGGSNHSVSSFSLLSYLQIFKSCFTVQIPLCYDIGHQTGSIQVWGLQVQPLCDLEEAPAPLFFLCKECSCLRPVICRIDSASSQENRWAPSVLLPGFLLYPGFQARLKAAWFQTAQLPREEGSLPSNTAYCLSPR